jgi:hypothetical protein
MFWGERVGKIIGSILVQRLMICIPHHQQNNLCQGIYCNKKFFIVCAAKILYLPKKKENSTDRQKQPIRQTGSRCSLFFRLTYTGRRTGRH